MHASGNDFVFLYNDISQLDIIKICDRKFGIGCDQLIIIDDFDEQSCKMNVSIYNQDGSMAKMCGNAMRCLAEMYAQSSRIIVQVKNGVSVEIFIKNGVSNVQFATPVIENDIVNNGNLHKVFIVNDFNNIDTRQNDKYNVNYVKIIDNSSLYVKTIERGVGETLSCGSGIIASCFYCKNMFKTNKINVLTDGSVILRNKFGIEDIISVEFEENAVFLQGNGHYVASGEIDCI